MSAVDSSASSKARVIAWTVVESPRERVETIHAHHRRRQSADCPFPSRRIAQRDVRAVIAADVARNDIVAVAAPGVDRVAQYRWQRRARLRPPRPRLDGDRRQRQGVARGPLSPSRNHEGNGRRSVHHDHGEAGGVEPEAAQRRGGGARAFVTRLPHRVANGDHCEPCLAHDVRGGPLGHDVAHIDGLSRPEVDDLAPREVHLPTRRQVEVDVALHVQQGAEHVEQLGFGRRRGRRVVRGVLVGAERLLVGVRRAVRVRDRGDRRILEQQRRVPANEVASEDALADDHRVVVRAIVVGDVHLVKPAVEAGQQQPRPPHMDGPVVAAHPERRVAGIDQETAVRRGGRLLARAARGQHAGNEYRQAQFTKHRPQDTPSAAAARPAWCAGGAGTGRRDGDGRGGDHRDRASGALHNVTLASWSSSCPGTAVRVARELRFSATAGTPSAITNRGSHYRDASAILPTPSTSRATSSAVV